MKLVILFKGNGTAAQAAGATGESHRFLTPENGFSPPNHAAGEQFEGFGADCPSSLHTVPLFHI